jgi:TPR repeat protein
MNLSLPSGVETTTVTTGSEVKSSTTSNAMSAMFHMSYDGPLDHRIQELWSQGYSPRGVPGQVSAVYAARRIQDGMTQDAEKALDYFRRALALGAPGAGYNLGYTYENGLGVPRDLKEAEKWYRRGAELGDGHAQLNLAVLAAQGASRAPDLEESYFWFSLAADGLSSPRPSAEALRCPAGPDLPGRLRHRPQH